MQTLYDIPFKKTNGGEMTLGEYRGKVILIVNTATKCGLAPQFE
jgi:glutathione peroxidase